MSSGKDAAAVSPNGTVRVTNPRSTGVAQAPGFVTRTAIKLSERVNEPTDGTVCAVDAAMGAEIGPYRKSHQGAEDRAKVLSMQARVKVPYGSFTRVLKTRDGSCLEDPSTDEFKFFAPGVGNIKVQSLDGAEEQHLISVTDSEDSED